MPAFELDSTPDTVNLRLCSEVTIEHAGALHQALQAALTADRTLVIDPAGLTRLDAAALQVLLAAARLAPRVQLTAPSAAWTAGLDRHGVRDPSSKS